MMQTPRDFAPTDSDALGVEAGDITYAALLDRHASEEPVTDDMIRRACLRMESARTWPLADAAGVPTDAPAAEARASTLARLFGLGRTAR